MPGRGGRRENIGRGGRQIAQLKFDVIKKLRRGQTNQRFTDLANPIDVIPRARWWADGGKYRDEMATIDPYRDDCPPEILQRQAEQYAQLFRIFRKHHEVIARISFWNLHDGQSWLNYFPWRRVNHPLLFDRAGQPKPAYGAVLEALTH